MLPTLTILPVSLTVTVVCIPDTVTLLFATYILPNDAVTFTLELPSNCTFPLNSPVIEIVLDVCNALALYALP